MMAARPKHNQAYLNGAVVLAALVGFVAQSWTVFFVATAIGVFGSMVGGDVRLNQRHPGASRRWR